jgi:PAS domain-containing protein
MILAGFIEGHRPQALEWFGLVGAFSGLIYEITARGTWLAVLSGAVASGLGYVIWYAALACMRGSARHGNGARLLREPAVRLTSMSRVSDRPKADPLSPRFLHLDDDPVLRKILEGTAASTGKGFFAALVLNLAEALGTHGAWVTEFVEETRRLRALAFWAGGHWVKDYEYDLPGSPCEVVVESRKLVHYPDNVLALYLDDPGMKGAGAVSCVGVPLLDELVGSAMDAIVQLDADLRVTLMNPAAEKVFAYGSNELVGQDFGNFLATGAN